MSDSSTSSIQDKLLLLLHYEEQLRTSQDSAQLAFRAINDGRQLITYRQAFIFI